MTQLISVVMPTYNRRETLEHVLPTLARQTYPADRYEILLCDSGSTDGTEELLTRLQIPNLRWLPGENRGRSGARNRGIQAAAGDLVLFTDADILAEPNLLEEHARAHAANPNCAVVGCEVQVNTLEEYEAVRNDAEARRQLHRKPRKYLNWLFFLTGNASAPREALVQAGMFEERFTGYGHEDIELGYRLMKMGMKIAYHPEARNYHWHPVANDERFQKAHLAGRSTVRFYRKHKDQSILLLMGVNPVTMGLHALVSEDGWFVRLCKSKAETSPSCKELAIQFHYLNGVKEALREPDDFAETARV